MINPLRRRNRDRGLTPGQRDEVQKLVFELVQTRLIHAFGPRGMFTVTPHDPTAVDTFFAQAVADTIAWDVAAKLATPGAVSAPIEQVSAALSAAVTAAIATPPVPVFAPPAADIVSLDTAPMPIPVADVAAAQMTDASVSVDTAGVAIVTSRFAPPAPPTQTQATAAQSTATSQVADARAKSAAASAPHKQLEEAGRQLVA